MSQLIAYACKKLLALLGMYHLPRRQPRETNVLNVDISDLMEQQPCNGYRQAEMEKEIATLRSENQSLQEQWSSSMDRQYERGINAGKDKMLAAVCKVLAMTSEELAAATDYGCKGEIYTEQVHTTEDDPESFAHAGQWAVYDTYCCYGGCEMPSYWPDEASARLYTAILNTAKIPTKRDMCSACSQEYYNSII